MSHIATFKLWPLEGKENLEVAWVNCRRAIDKRRKATEILMDKINQ